LGGLQLPAVHQAASDSGWCPAITSRISTQLVNSTDCDDASTQVLKELAVGDDHPTILFPLIWLALYEKVFQLLDSRPDL